MYSDGLWEQWLQNELPNYSQTNNGKKHYIKRGYVHLDNRFWFPDRHDEIKEIARSGLKVPHPHTGKQQFYSFSPFLKVLTKTPKYRYQQEEGYYDLETKIRPICFAAHVDGLLLGFYSFALTKRYETFIQDNGFDDVVLAYRSDLGKCNIQFAKEVFDLIRVRGKCSAIALDIKGYFDHIDHGILLEKWKKVIGGRLPDDQFKIFEMITQYSYISQGSLLRKYRGRKKRDDVALSNLMEIIPGSGLPEKFARLRKDQLIVSNDKPMKGTDHLSGVPQGSPISAVLSNIYLIDFDRDLKLKGDVEGFVYRRYCDDILIICDTNRAFDLMNFVIDKISKEYKLTIQQKKVDLIDFFENSKGQIRGFRRPTRTRRKIGEKEKVTILAALAKLTVANESKLYKSLQYLGFEYNGKDIRIRASSLSRYFWKLNYRLQRTVIMAYSPKAIGRQIFLKQIYERYTHLGRRNFLTYAYNASKLEYTNADRETLAGLNSPAIRRQLRQHLTILHHELARKNIKWYEHKLTGKKAVTFKAVRAGRA